jgi:hypothetical protein
MPLYVWKKLIPEIIMNIVQIFEIMIKKMKIELDNFLI